MKGIIKLILWVMSLLAPVAAAIWFMTMGNTWWISGLAGLGVFLIWCAIVTLFQVALGKVGNKRVK